MSTRQRGPWLLLIPLLLAGCGGPDQRPDGSADEPPPGTAAARPAEPSPPAPASRSLAHSNAPEVLRAIPTSAQKILQEAETFEVLLIACERSPAPDEASCQGYPVIQRRVVEDPLVRIELLERIYRGLVEARGMALCFEPHHAVRAVRGDVVVELVICFECERLTCHEPGRPQQGGATGPAAEPLLTELLGPIRDRAFEGRTLAEWRSHLGGLADAAAQGQALTLTEEDQRGVVTLARSLSWGVREAEAGSQVLIALGPAAAPATEALRATLQDDQQAWAWLHTVQVVRRIGPGAAPAVPALMALLRKDISQFVARWRAYERKLDALGDDDPEPPGDALEEEDAAEVRDLAVIALGEIGPAAAEAVPLLEKLAEDGNELASEALRAVQGR